MAQRATSLGSKPSLSIFFCFCFFVPFLSLLLIKNPCFPPKNGIFCLFSVFLFLSPSAFSDLPLFCFSFSVSLLLLSFFLPSCLSFCFFFFLVFVSFSVFFLLCFSFLSSLLLFSEKNNMKILNCNLFFCQSFLFFMVSSLVFPFKSLFLCFCFLILSYVFVQHECFWFQNKQLKKKHIYLVKRGGCNKTVFYQPVFCKM